MSDRPDSGSRPQGATEALAPGDRPPAAIATDPTLATPPGTDPTLATPPGTGPHAPAVRDDLVGKTLDGRYTILEPLGKGGMSVVYVARHELLKKIVAIKLLREEIAANKASLSRFHREAMAAAAIGDPHIVDVTDYGFTQAGEAFIVMERLEGQNLRQLITAQGALPAGRAIAIARQILRALSAAHARGIVHRDLKAENVFLTQREGHDFVKLLDFGITKILQAEPGSATGLTGTGVVMGTPQYIAPEQAHGAPDVDHRVDIYSLGVILYEMITGTLPFTGNTALEVMMKHVQEAPQPPHLRRPDLAIPPEVEQVVLKALAKSAADRYASADEMLAALPSPTALPGGFVSGALSAAPQRGTRWPAIAAGIAAFLAVAGVGAYLLRDRISPAVAPRADSRAARPDIAVVAPATVPASRQGPDARIETVTLVISATPKHATITVEGQQRGDNGQASVTLPRERPVSITVEAAGHQGRTLRLVPRKDDRVSVVLKPAKKTKKGPKQTKEGIYDNPYPK
jgi:serine/threonine-protein kinase